MKSTTNFMETRLIISIKIFYGYPLHITHVYLNKEEHARLPQNIKILFFIKVAIAVPPKK